MIDKTKNIHFIGIKGSGMSALAQVLFDMGYKISGSDIEKHFFTQDRLEEKGIKITTFSESNVRPEDIVVITKAFNETNPEVSKAMEYDNYYYYTDFLAKVIDNFEVSVGVSGCHGKTTTTGLLSHLLKNVDKASYLIGDGTGEGNPGSKYFVFEACEYKNHFLNYHPDYAIITNIDFDHPDFFKSPEEVVASFVKFSNNAKKAVVVYGDQKETEEIKHEKKVVRYGFGSHNDVFAEKVRVDTNGTTFDFVIKNQSRHTVTIPMYGNHHILNTLAVLTIMTLEGFEVGEVARYLANFSGVKRRFNETKMGTNIVIDDYAHHPTEIKATLQSIRLKYPDKKAVVLFQPHTYSRTLALFDGFVDALQGFDEVYMADIFGSAREKQNDGVMITSEDILNKIHGKMKAKIEDVLPMNFFTYDNSVIAFLGAGDVNKYKDEFINKKAL